VTQPPAGPRGTETLDVLVVGDVMVDVLAAMSGPLARGSDTPSTIRTTGGGSAANVAAWLAHQGVRTSYVGRVGDDPLGRESVSALHGCGVTTYVTTDPESTTGTCVVLVEPGGERSMLPDSGANTTLAPEHLPEQPFRPGAHLHLSGYTLLNEGSRDAGRAAIATAREAGMTVSVDPSSAAPLERVGAARFLGWTHGVDVLLANRDEAAVLAGTVDPHAAAQRLGDSYAEVVVKLGADGALWQRGFIGASAPAERGVEVVDTTGAGDAFAAGFLASWLLHPEPESALAAGNRLAARVVGTIGARP
jgi:sugar/nucleoside kinase (ribokinase family)